MSAARRDTTTAQSYSLVRLSSRFAHNPGELFGSDRSSRSGALVDDDLLAKCLGELIGDNPRDDASKRNIIGRRGGENREPPGVKARMSWSGCTSDSCTSGSRKKAAWLTLSPCAQPGFNPLPTRLLNQRIAPLIRNRKRSISHSGSIRGGHF
jgi:hypothetical protein